MANHRKESDLCMRDHLHFASARRDDRLARIRKLTLWVGGAAAAASLGLGTAFAHALPGHAATAARTTHSKATPGGRSPGGGQSAAPSVSASPQHSAHHHRAALAKPTQQPAPTQAPPVVNSGGS
jgi:hypothetical protein